MSSREDGALARELERAAVGELRLAEPLAPRTSVRAGGAAELYLRPASLDGLVRALRLARDAQAALTILGGGANTLVGDGGVPGLTLTLPSQLVPEEAAVGSEEGLLTLGAGAAIARLIVLMKAHGLVGAEFLAGIPGTLGGACAMNAGTKNGECMTVVDAVEWATADGVGWVPRASLCWEYRHTALPSGAVLTRLRFRLPKGDGQASQAKMDADLAYRKRTQPLQLPNFGSVFRNPPGDHAGRLIESVGLKGHRVGGAEISTLHANWIVNLGFATAKDITTLMETAVLRVREATGVALVPEVRRVGIFL